MSAIQENVTLDNALNEYRRTIEGEDIEKREIAEKMTEIIRGITKETSESIRLTRKECWKLFEEINMAVHRIQKYKSENLIEMGIGTAQLFFGEKENRKTVLRELAENTRSLITRTVYSGERGKRHEIKKEAKRLTKTLPSKKAIPQTSCSLGT